MEQPPCDLAAIIDRMMMIGGAQGAAIVDARSGLCLAEKRPLEQAESAPADTSPILARLGRMMTETGNLEDMVSTFQGHQHIIRPLQGDFMEGFFLCLVVERSLDSDILARARYQLMHLVFGLSIPTPESQNVPLVSPHGFGEMNPFAAPPEHTAEQILSLQ